MVIVTVAHVAVGAMTLAASIVLAIQIRRNVRPQRAEAAEQRRGDFMNAYLELTKPRITVFILMSTAIGFLCGSHLRPPGAWFTLLHTLLGHRADRQRHGGAESVV